MNINLSQLELISENELSSYIEKNNLHETSVIIKEFIQFKHFYNDIDQDDYKIVSINDIVKSLCSFSTIYYYEKHNGMYCEYLITLIDKNKKMLSTLTIILVYNESRNKFYTTIFHRKGVLQKILSTLRQIDKYVFEVITNDTNYKKLK